MVTGTAVQPPRAGRESAFGPGARHLDRLLLASSLAAVTVFVFVGMGRSVWLDEANCILIANRSLSGIVEALRHDNNFPFYYFLLALWMRLFGNSEVALRALSAIFYLAGGAAAFVLGRRVCGSGRGAWYSAFFYLASALAIRQAQNIRMYALLGMLSGLSFLAFFRLVFDKDRSRRARALFLAVNSIGILTHVWFAFVLIAQLLAVMLFQRRRLWTWMAWAAVAALPCLVLWSPAFLDQLHNGATAWMPSFAAGVLLFAPLEFYGFLPGMMLYGTAIGVWLLAGPTRGGISGTNLSVIFLIFVTSLGLPLLVSVARPIYGPGRYGIIALAPLAVLLGGVLSSLLPRPALPIAGMLLLAAGVANQIAHRDEIPEAELPAGQSDRVTAQFLLAHAGPGDAIVFTSLTRAPADYYFLRAHAETGFLEISFPEETAAHLGWLDPGVPPGRRRPLELEAEATTRRLRHIFASGRHVWVYHGGAPLVTEVLQQKLDAVLPRPREYALWGPYHRSLLEYADPSASGR